MNPYEPPVESSGEPKPAAPISSSGLTVLGIVMAAFGGLGLLSAPYTLFTRELGNRTGSARIQEILWTGTIGTWMYISLVLGTLLSVVLLAAGIGILKRRPWAHKASIAYSAGAIGLAVLAQIVNILFLYPALSEAADSSDPVSRGAAMGGIVGGIAGGCFGLILPIIILVLMRRPGTKQALGVT